MEIYANLLLDSLKVRFSVSSYGRLTNTPLLRPVFYQSGTTVEKNRVYIVRPGALPPRTSLDFSNLLICAEGVPSLSYQHSGLPLFIVREETAMTVFNDVLTIFERYDTWEKSLRYAVDSGADIAELVNLTAPLIPNDITVIDSELRVIAAANYRQNQAGEIEVVHPTELFETMPLNLIHQYKSGIEGNRNKRGSYFADQGCYCVNFHHNDRYLGNLSLYPRVGNLRPSDPYIIDILAAYVQEAFQIQAKRIRSQSENIEKFVRDLLDGKTIPEKQMNELTKDDWTRIYHGTFCFYIPLNDKPQHLSAESIIQTFLNHFPHLMIFPYQSSLVGLNGLEKEAASPKAFAEKLEGILRQLDLRAGVSTLLYNIRKIRFHYEQARYALDFGRENNTAGRLFFFEDYTLQYLLVNSTGIFPVECLCPPGLLRLSEYDAGSEVDYWGTLRCYLDEQMNLAQTSKILNIHRNTLIHRIERINSVLDMNLNDPNVRLWIRIAIYLRDMEHK